MVYTIGYDLDAGGGAPERCMRPNLSTGHSGGAARRGVRIWGCTAYDAIQAMASRPHQFYNKPNPGKLDAIFMAIARDLLGSRGRLIDNTSPSLPSIPTTEEPMRQMSAGGDGDGESGQAFVEFALVLPLCSCILLGVIQFGNVFRDYIALADATRVGARQAAVSR